MENSKMKDILSKKNGDGTPENFTLSLFKVTDYPDTPTTRANCALIFSPYGEVLNQATKFHVAETLIDSDGKVYFPGGEGGYPTNFVTLKIHPFSGEVEYVQY